MLPMAGAVISFRLADYYWARSETEQAIPSTRGKLTEPAFVCFVSFAVIHSTMHVCCVRADENRERNETDESRRE